MENFNLEEKMAAIAAKRRAVLSLEKSEMRKIEAAAELQRINVRARTQEELFKLAAEQDKLTCDYREWKKKYLAELDKQKND